MENKKHMINQEDFSKIEIRVGTIISAEIFREAKKPAYKVWIDFGETGVKKSSAQLTKRYHPEDLPGKQIVSVINFPPKQVANYYSECLILGVMDNDEVTLLTPDKSVKNGLLVG